MAKIPRVPVKVFGSEGPVAQFAQYGSLAEGKPQKTKDLSLIQGLNTYLQGMFPATSGADKPPAIEDENALRYLLSSLIAYTYQEGIPEWDPDTDYFVNSLVKDQGLVYRALVANKNKPVFVKKDLNATYWKRDYAYQDDFAAHEGLKDAHGATTTATASRLILRDDHGRAQIAAPQSDQDIVNLGTLLPVGWCYEQHLNWLTPAEMNWPGVWEKWNDRADGYGLRSTPLPNYTLYTQGATYAIGAYVLYHPIGSDAEIFQAKVNITNAPQQLDPVNWTKLTPGIILERRDLQGWQDDDFVIGEQISSGSYAGWYVCEVIVPGGKYTAAAGLNRPTFVNDGVARDVSRPVTGIIAAAGTGIFNQGGNLGVFYPGSAHGYMPSERASAGSAIHLGFDSSRVVPTASESSPRTLSTLYWRRVA